MVGANPRGFAFFLHLVKAYPMTILDPKTGLKVDLPTGTTRRPAERGTTGERIEGTPKALGKGPRDRQATPAKPAR